MDSMPVRLQRRELGWNSSTQRSDYKKFLCSLDCREEDRVSLSANNLLLTTHNDSVNPIYDLGFCSNNGWLNIVAAADEKGFMTLINTHEGVKSTNKIVDRHRCHENALCSLDWSPCKLGQVLSGSADCSVKLWDVNRGFTLVRDFKRHSRTVKTVKFHPSQTDTFLSASRDGSIMVWDARCGHESPENMIPAAHNVQNKKKTSWENDLPVTDALYKDENTIVSCGSGDGFIKFWDIRKTYKYLKKREPVRQIPHPYKETTCNGYSSLCLDEMNNLYAASAATDIFKFNLSSESDKPEAYFTNNANMQFFIKMDVSRDGRFLLAGSMNSFAHLWDTWDLDSRSPFTYLEGHTLDSTIGCGAFSRADPLTVVTGADDAALMIWRVNNMKSQYKMVGYNGASEKEKEGSGSSSVRLPKAPLDSIRRKQEEEELRRSKTPNSEAGTASSTLNLCSLLSDLPNFVIDGRMCHVPEKVTHPAAKKPSWLLNFASEWKKKEKRPAEDAVVTTTTRTLRLGTPPKRRKLKKY